MRTLSGTVRTFDRAFSNRCKEDWNMLSIYRDISGSAKLDEITQSLHERVSQDPRLILFF
ncbi:MAG: hypothetical protein IT364_25565 [Candidatus Hydrogenedentes bacterium]|nr:hypothetical protein [Candidatus Hydrogenedentota bacterium]